MTVMFEPPPAEHPVVTWPDADPHRGTFVVMLVIIKLGTLTAAVPDDPVCASVSVLGPLFAVPSITCADHESVALAAPLKYVPAMVKIGEFCGVPLTALVTFAQVHVAEFV